jgi:pyruvate-ferredoxin/flavodoxin oxidoreductase
MTATAIWDCVDGNEAAARVAHALSELIAIYPITPASPMGELADTWSADARPNLWGTVPEVVEMQSEAGAAGVLHGALQKGVLATTFTASQGLLLMLPNMYKIAGELTPAVIHVAARTVATHALSIFGDHSDVMAARPTGWAMLAPSSVQEAQDLALVAHAATLRTRVPFVHFFDGFRTSHEIDKIQLLTADDLRALVHEDDVVAHRRRGLTPDRPVLRGSAQNPDVFFQAREAANRFYDAVPDVVAQLLAELADRTGRRYGLVDYVGDPAADRVLVLMGSGAEAAKDTVEELRRGGERVGLLVVRLYRPFPATALCAALPDTVRRLAVLDRTKEPGATGEPLYLDVVAALAEHGPASVEVVGGRYGLASKEFTPAMVKGVFDELAVERPRRHITVGITDDLTGLSVPVDRSFRVPSRAVQAVFFGVGADGTVGAAKSSIKIIGSRKDLFAQGYFVYDSRKSGTLTTSHLRFGPEPIHATYLIDQADFVACHQFGLLGRTRVVELAKPGATFLLNSPYPADQVWPHLPAEVRQQIVSKQLTFYVVDAHAVARSVGLGGRINTVMQPCFFHLSGVLPAEDAIPRIKDAIRHSYANRGAAVVERNLAAVDGAVAALTRVDVPTDATDESKSITDAIGGDDFVTRVTARLLAGDGDLLPVSAMPVDGTFPTGTAGLEKRRLAREIPVWDPDLCTDCGKCVLVCPHAAIRMKAFPPAALTGAPAGFKSKEFASRELPGHQLTVQVAPDDCTGCGICVEVCPAVSRTDPAHKSIDLLPAAEHADRERPHWEFFLSIPEMPREAVRHDNVKGSALLQPLFEFPGACEGCGETPYLRLLSQLFGDRLLIANATGCSSIYGGNLPTTPWSRNADGRGPAWANSLFEDNAEFGLGLRLGWERQHADAQRLVGELADVVGPELAAAILDADQSTEAAIAAQRVRVQQLRSALFALEATLPAAARLLTLADELVEKSVWLVGGDGWAYDIGFGGLDHVLASGRNVNVLVLDTEVYSNTGGQASKSTPRGAAARFATRGKATAKKDLGALAMTYGNVYVAQIALGAGEMAAVRALQEAAAHPGPALVIAYSSCIEHGIDMVTSMAHQKDAVASGVWPLYRYRPNAAQPFHLDAKRTGLSVREFALTENRYAMLAQRDPERSAELLALAQEDVDRRWQRYEDRATQP